jgi:putative transposase
MQVRRSCYYNWRTNVSYGLSAAKISQAARIKECFYVHRRRYGSRRIAAALEIGRHRVRSVMKREDLKAIAPKRFVPRTTDSKHGLAVSPNLLQDGNNARLGKSEVFVGDITYLRLRSGGFCYLACLQDKFTRRLIGWKVSERMTAQLVIDVFLQARRRGLIGKGAIIHTDQGSQYAAVEYRRLLYIGGFRQSMSRKGNCYDNAQAESFFSRFKAELVENGIFESVEQARSEVFGYIEGYYNRVRLHSGLNYQSPMEFEKQLELENKIRSKESFVSWKTWPSHVVRKVLDGQSVSSVSREIGVNESLIHKWRRAALNNGDGIKSGAELAEAAALKKRIRETGAGEWNLKKGGTYLRQRKLKRYEFIDKEKANHPVKLLCRMMQTSVSAYYFYARAESYQETRAQKSCREKVRTCFFEHRRRYGTRRIAAELKIGRAAARSAMRRMGLQAIAPKSFKPQTTDSHHGLPVCANLLQAGMNAPTARGEVFLGDITYLRLQNGGFCYLACLQDKFTRRIVGWKVSTRMTAQLVIDVFLQARRGGLIKRSAIIHTDQGQSICGGRISKTALHGRLSPINVEERKLLR